jgi:hypothetical protein
MDGPADTRSPGKQIVKKNNLDINFVGARKGATGTLDDLKSLPPIPNETLACEGRSGASKGGPAHPFST